MQFTTRGPLLQQLFILLAAHRAAFAQERIYQRMVCYVLGQLMALGRHTLTQVLVALGLTAQDWSAWYRLFSQDRFHAPRVAACLLEQVLRHVAPEQWLMVGLDGVHLARASRRMPGTSWLRALKTAPFAKGLQRMQRFVHLAWLVPVEAGYSRALPLRFLPAFTQKAVPAACPPRTETETGLVGLCWLRAQLRALGRAGQRVLVVADGRYDTVAFWRALPERTYALVRTAKNRTLYALPRAQKERGRKRLYGPRLPTPHAFLAYAGGWKRIRFQVRGREQKLTYRVVGPCRRKRTDGRVLFLLVVRGERYHQRRKRREPSYLLVNALEREGHYHLPLPVEALLAAYWQRWELEVTHRELKSNWGIGQSQCWHPLGTYRAVQAAVWSYAVVLLAGYRTWGLLGAPPVPTRWWRGARRWSFNTLWRALRSELWGGREFRPLWPPSPGNRPEIAAWHHGQDHALMGALKA